MASNVIRRAWFGWANANAPGQSGARTATGTSIALTFSAALLPANPTVSQFTATVAGAARGVTNAVVAGSVLTLTLASAVTAGQAVVATYKPAGAESGKLKDAQGDLVSGFTTPSITAT
jgi:uncharacterized repeat protein (TIGR02059 family)